MADIRILDRLLDVEHRSTRRAPEPVVLTDDPLTESGAAERFARLHGDDVRYDHRRARWLLWDRHRWAPDSDAGITRLAVVFSRDWQRQAMDIADRDRREAAVRFALRLERRDTMNNVLTLARAMYPVADAGDRWDADPYLLSTPTGIIDLATGIARPGRREDRITMRTAVAFDPDACCPRWESVVASIFADDDELIGFVRRAVGYSLLGLTVEQVLFLLFGSGANGKGTFANTLKAVLGDYGWNMPFATVEMRDRAAIPNDLAALVGRRFVIASETNDGARLNEARVKALTGCDPITARFMRSEFFTFEPVAKFWLSLNHKPVVRDDSHGFWRRLRLIPFTQTFPVNPALADELRDEAPGILTWAVRGCLEYQERGLDAPDVVLAATREYEVESDALASFLDEAVDLDPEAECTAGDLYGAYRKWADGHQLTDRERLTATAFGRKLGERFPARRIQGTKRYQGLARRLL